MLDNRNTFISLLHQGLVFIFSKFSRQKYAEPHCGSFQFKGNSQVFIILVNVMQLQYMRMLNQFQNGNLPLNLV